MDVIHSAASKLLPSLRSSGKFPCLLKAIAAVHIGYYQIEVEIHWFAELSKLFSVVPSLVAGQAEGANEVVLNFYFMVDGTMLPLNSNF